MGHYASEMDSEWDSRVEWSDRLHELRTKLKRYSLDKFKASDIPLLNILYNYNEHRSLSKEDVSYLESIYNLKP